MSTFTYTALSRDGKRTTGSLSADSRAAAIAEVTRKGLSPLKVDEQRNGSAAARPAAAKPAAGGNGQAGGGGRAPTLPTAGADVARPGKVKQKAVEAFTRDLANLLAGGVSLARALSLLKREASSPAAKHLWGRINDDVVGGKALAEAMAEHPKTFSSVYVAMVRAGEQGGFLDVVLQQIADFRAREADLKGKVMAALIYPSVLAFVAIIVVALLLTFFIPQFSEMFKDFGATLPWLTQVIVAVSDVFRKFGIYVVIALAIGGFALWKGGQSDAGRRRVERLVLGVPLLGRVVARFAMVRFCRMLGTLVGSGVPLVASLKTAREAIGNQTLSDAVGEAIAEVQRGEALSRSLGASPELFPASVIETIAVAEETGRLDKELVRVAVTYEGDLERQLRMLVAVAEPLLLVVMAGVIGTIVVGMLLPVFKLQEMIK